jgi:hypothetical protein
VDRSSSAKQREVAATERVGQLQTELEIARDQVKQLQQQLKHAVAATPAVKKSPESNIWDSKSGELNSVDDVLLAYVPDKEREEVRRILFGSKAQSLTLPEAAHESARKLEMDLVGYRIPA